MPSWLTSVTRPRQVSPSCAVIKVGKAQLFGGGRVQCGRLLRRYRFELILHPELPTQLPLKEFRAQDTRDNRYRGIVNLPIGSAAAPIIATRSLLACMCPLIATRQQQLL